MICLVSVRTIFTHPVGSTFDRVPFQLTDVFTLIPPSKHSGTKAAQLARSSTRSVARASGKEALAAFAAPRPTMSRASTPSLAAAAASSPSPSSPSPSSRGGGDHRGSHHHHPPRRFATTPLTGVRDLVREGKTIWLLDQFGVLHDGKTAYPAAIHATKRLYDAGAKLYVISNSSRRSAKTLAKLEPMGFDPAWFAGAITSGEMTWRALEARDAFEGSAEADARGPKPFAGDKVLHFTWSERGSIALDGLGAFCVLRTAYSFSLIVLRFQRLIASPFN